MANMIKANRLTWDTSVTDILKDFSFADVEKTKNLTIRNSVSASNGHA